ILLCWLLRPALSAGFAVLLCAALISLILCLVTRFTRWQPLLLCGLALGFFLCAAQYAALAAWPVPPGGYAEISGTVKGAPVVDDDGVYRLRLAVERVDGERVASADIYLKAEGPPPVAGSRITAEGYCLKHYYYANPGAFDYREYLAQQGIAAQVSAVYNGWVRVDEAGPALTLSSLGQWLRHGFEQALSPFSPEERALVRGVFLGDDSGLDREARVSISLSGMAHVFAVSGLHVGYLVLLVRFVCGGGFRRRRLRFGLTLFLLLLYLSLCGWTASVLRASVMALALLAAELFMEENDPVSSLSAAALLCLALRPLWLFSAGFQLSVLAVWAMYALGPLLCRLLKTERQSLGGTLCYSLAAVLGTAPLICHYFFYVPWWGWLLSPLVVTLAGVAVVLCLLGLVASVFWLPAAIFVLQGAVWVMRLLAGGARLLGSWHISAYSGALSWPWLLLAYGALLAAPLVFRRLERRGRPAALSLLARDRLIPLAFSGGGRVDRDSPLPHTLARVTFLDVGQGDCALLRTADGLSALIDGGG
ncbi:MAG: ComEC/Rec2 family competence protein, partial [Firmicutes bacterium]|nr:ComEC/Rec2 family competence protein [Bacillota bacterium]